MIPCAKSELLLFDDAPVQTSIASSSWIDFHSLSDPSSSNQLEFLINGSQDEYIDFNDTKLYLRIKVTSTPAESLIAPVNSLISSLFSDVSIQLNDITVQGGEPYYPYKAMIENMLLFDNSSKKTQLEAGGFVKDEAEKFNDATNSSHIKRAGWVENGKSLELIGPLHLDLATQPRYILPRVDIRVRMIRSMSEFCLNSWANPSITKCDVTIDKAILFVRKVRVMSSVLHGHEMGLETSNAIYPIQHVSMDCVTVPSGQLSFTKEHIFQGRMPKFLVVAMVKNSGFVGSLTNNPFLFEHFNVGYFGLFRDGECIPERTPFVIEDNDSFARVYQTMFHSLELFNRNDTNGITMRDFKHGSMFFVLNLTPDLTVGSGCQQAYRTGNMRIEVKFRSALTTSINILLYGVFDGKIEISKDRNIFIDYI